LNPQSRVLLAYRLRTPGCKMQRRIP
jgi:hypothetical protein